MPVTSTAAVLHKNAVTIRDGLDSAARKTVQERR